MIWVCGGNEGLTVRISGPDWSRVSWSAPPGGHVYRYTPRCVCVCVPVHTHSPQKYPKTFSRYHTRPKSLKEQHNRGECRCFAPIASGNNPRTVRKPSMGVPD